MSRFHGRHGEIQINGAALTGQSKWTLDMDTDVADCTAFGDTNKQSVQGLSTRKGQFSGFWDTTSVSALVAAVDSTTAITVRITPTMDNAAQYFEGPAWINANFEGDIKDVVKASAKFEAAGAWSSTGF